MSAAVGLGLPGGALVCGAGALFGPGPGLLTVHLAQAIALLLNWVLCRGLLRPKMERWLARTPKARLLEQLIGQPAGLKFLLLLRLELIPRFALMVLARPLGGCGF